MLLRFLFSSCWCCVRRMEGASWVPHVLIHSNEGWGQKLLGLDLLKSLGRGQGDGGCSVLLCSSCFRLDCSLVPLLLSVLTVSQCHLWGSGWGPQRLHYFAAVCGSYGLLSLIVEVGTVLVEGQGYSRTLLLRYYYHLELTEWVLAWSKALLLLQRHCRMEYLVAQLVEWELGFPIMSLLCFPSPGFLDGECRVFLSPCSWFRVAHLSRTQSRDSWEIKGRYCLLLLKTWGS